MIYAKEGKTYWHQASNEKVVVTGVFEGSLSGKQTVNFSYGINKTGQMTDDKFILEFRLLR